MTESERAAWRGTTRAALTVGELANQWEYRKEHYWVELWAASTAAPWVTRKVATTVASTDGWKELQWAGSWADMKASSMVGAKGAQTAVWRAAWRAAPTVPPWVDEKAARWAQWTVRPKAEQ